MIEHTFEKIYDLMPQASMVLDADLVFVAANDAYCRAVKRSKSDLIGRYIFDVFPDTADRIEPVRRVFLNALAGQVTKIDAQPYELLLEDGTLEDRIWYIEQHPLKLDSGTAYMVQYCEDITEREALRIQRDLVTAELNHRVRNTLAVVQSVAEHTGLASADIRSFLKGFSGRLAAMSRNFAALTDSHWQGLDFETILRTELEPYAGPVYDRIKHDGPEVKLTVRTSKFTSMLVHELITNASKYGFLTSPDGRLSLRWWIDENVLHAEWHETGLVNVQPPTELGFGFQLFKMMENIEVEYEFLPTGLKLHFGVPIEMSSATGEIEYQST